MADREHPCLSLEEAAGERKVRASLPGHLYQISGKRIENRWIYISESHISTVVKTFVVFSTDESVQHCVRKSD